MLALRIQISSNRFVLKLFQLWDDNLSFRPVVTYFINIQRFWLKMSLNIFVNPDYTDYIARSDSPWDNRNIPLHIHHFITIRIAVVFISDKTIIL